LILFWDGLLKVIGFNDFRNSKDKQIPVKPELWFCRCGESRNKSFCDRSQADVRFRDDEN
jgi:CDGSH-type Zn-finger protein